MPNYVYRTYILHSIGETSGGTATQRKTEKHEPRLVILALHKGCQVLKRRQIVLPRTGNMLTNKTAAALTERGETTFPTFSHFTF